MRTDMPERFDDDDERCTENLRLMIYDTFSFFHDDLANDSQMASRFEVMESRTDMMMTTRVLWTTLSERAGRSDGDIYLCHRLGSTRSCYVSKVLWTLSKVNGHDDVDTYSCVRETGRKI